MTKIVDTEARAAPVEVAEAAKSGTDVAVVEDKSNVPALIDVDELVADSGKGNEGLSLGDLSVPYIYILQSNSPQLNPGKPDKYLPNAKIGDFFNTASNETWNGREKGMVIIPTAFERKLVQWHDRDAGGGWVKDWSLDSGILAKTKLDDKKRPRLPDGDVIVETAYHYDLVLSGSGRWIKAIIPFKSTALQAHRRIGDLVEDSTIPPEMAGGRKGLRAPRWFYPFLLKTVLTEKNGQSWWSFKVDKLGPSAADPANPGQPVSADLYRMAKEFNQQFNDGLITRAVDTEADPAVGGASAPAGGGQADTDDEIPF